MPRPAGASKKNQAAIAAGSRQPFAREQIVDSLALAAQVVGRLRDRHGGRLVLALDVLRHLRDDDRSGSLRDGIQRLVRPPAARRFCATQISSAGHRRAQPGVASS
jgi:hypothetical protein